MHLNRKVIILVTAAAYASSPLKLTSKMHANSDYHRYVSRCNAPIVSRGVAVIADAQSTKYERNWQAKSFPFSLSD